MYSSFNAQPMPHRAALVALDVTRMDRLAGVLGHGVAHTVTRPVSSSTSTSTTWLPKLGAAPWALMLA